MTPSLSDIKNATVEYYRDRRITVKDLDGPARVREVARPRQVAMYLSLALTTHSMPKIGRAFARHHTTVLHARRAVEVREECLSDAEAIRRVLDASTASRVAFAQTLAAARAIADFVRSLPALPVERDWMRVGEDTAGQVVTRL